MPYVQILALCVGLVLALGYIADNHVNRSQGAQYAWIHPRFIALGATVLSSAWLLLWPIIDGITRHPLRTVAACCASAVLFAVVLRWLNTMQRIAAGVLLVPVASLLAGGMPSDVSWTANLAIVNIAPTMYIIHHKKDNGLRHVIARYDIRAAYVVWLVGHVLAYWAIAVALFHVGWPVVVWLFVHTRVIGRSLALLLIAGACFWVISRMLRVFRSRTPRPPRVRPPDQQAPHFIVD